MPGPSFGLPTAECKTGGKLRDKKGSVCSHCYAHKRGNYRFAAVVEAQFRRLDHFNSDPEQWVKDMVRLLDGVRWFRWFDSGDLQSTLMLSKIVEVCDQTPWCNHWLATRERRYVREFLRNDSFPANLTVRVSATYPDVPAKPLHGCGVGNVHWKNAPVGLECSAPSNGGKCGDCRACWDKTVEAVSYKRH